jgi:hypothetical protein
LGVKYGSKLPGNEGSAAAMAKLITAAKNSATQ